MGSRNANRSFVVTSTLTSAHNHPKTHTTTLPSATNMNSQHVASVLPKAASRQAARHIWSRAAAAVSSTSSSASHAAAALGSAVTSSGLLSFTSPESDFVAANVGNALSQNATTKKRDYSSIAQNYSLTSPENDFIVSSLPKCQSQQQYSSTPHNSWSKTLNYASPESDFSSETLRERANRIWDESQPRRSGAISYSTPESDFSSASVSAESLEDAADRVWHQNEEVATNMAYSLSYASPEADFTSPQVFALLTDQQKRQLDHCNEASSAEWTHRSASAVAEYDTRRELLDDHAHAAATEPALSPQEQFHFEDIYAKTDASGPLPTTLHEAELIEDQAVVITESSLPFRIVRVNAAWEGLCGYTQDEARGKTLGDLLQGPETDVGAATALVDKLIHGEEAGAVLTNYAKGGRKFQNRIRVGTLKNQHDKVTHFVGVLKEIHEMSEKIVGSGSKQEQVQMA